MCCVVFCSFEISILIKVTLLFCRVCCLRPQAEIEIEFDLIKFSRFRAGKKRTSFRKVWTPLCHGTSDSDSAQTWQEDRSLGSLAAILECDLKAQEQTSRNKDQFFFFLSPFLPRTSVRDGPRGEK